MRTQIKYRNTGAKRILGTYREPLVKTLSTLKRFSDYYRFDKSLTDWKMEKL